MELSPIRVLYIYGIGGNPDGEKPRYLRKRFQHVCIPPKLKHSDHRATRETLDQAVTEFSPDIVVAHAAGVAKAVALATNGQWSGPLVLLGGGRACSSVSDIVGRAVTVVIPDKDAEAGMLRRAMRLNSNQHMLTALEVADDSSLNASMVGEDRLFDIIVQTSRRHDGVSQLGPEPAVSESQRACDQVRWSFSECADEHGQVSQEEFNDIFNKICPAMPKEHVSQLAQTFFKGTRGTIDIDDFVLWVFSGGETGIHVEQDVSSSTMSAANGCPAHSSTVDVSNSTLLADAVTSTPSFHGSLGGVPDAALDADRDPLVDIGVESTVALEGGSQRFGSAVAPVAAGQLFTWGRGSDGQLGQDTVIHPSPNCALPHPVPGMHDVVHVACGGGQQGCTAAVTAGGQLFTFGNNYKGRLGHGEGPCVREPRQVRALEGTPVLMVACGPDHSAALVFGGRVFLWGCNRYGQLGRGHCEANPDCVVPGEVCLPMPATQIDCEDQYSAAVLEDGRLFTWGSNGHGRLGIGSSIKFVAVPSIVDVQVSSVSLGSLYAGAIGTSGELFMWGYGGHGNLGLGNRASVNAPAKVEMPEPAAQLACTRGQEGCKGGLNPSNGGQEGPHTVIVTQSGDMYTMGTCHKGLLCNLGNKDGAFGKPWDELKPYRVGGRLRNGHNNPPLSPLAVWPPPYNVVGPVSKAVSAHIHAACVGVDGKAWAWGCGSNDGRCGVERFLNKQGEGRPPEVDMMKCYMMGPHRIGIARPLYWKYSSLQGLRVSFLATGRNHMACIALPE